VPIYVYKCPGCDRIVKLERPIEERDTEVSCDTCKEVLERVFKLGGVTFRGSGWGSQ